jgi:signal transduction histidine kinase
LQIAPNLPFIWGDKTCLSRALHHLLENARKFTPGGGHIVLNLGQEDENIVLTASDTGIGIPEDQFELIFELGVQVDATASRTQGGTGLGLALVKKVIENHAGTVSVTSLPGQGSTFTVALPINSGPTPIDAFLEF